jgi:predicted 2-oxoglutarate/Fe(II)-dependent dioxygenase YbiX
MNKSLILTDFIKVYDLSFPSDFMSSITQKYKNNFTSARFGVDNKIDFEVRRCSIVNIDLSSRNDFDVVIFDQVSSILEQYQNTFSDLKCLNDCGYTLVKYEEGGFYKEHTDFRIFGQPRVLSISMLLNDDFVGGEFSFFGGTHVVKLKENQAVCFPSNFMFPHAIMPIIHGTRYAITTWAF